jgi:beta-lactamase superfamily II metal-dependent hydrolase
MAKKKNYYNKKTAKQIEKFAKKNPKTFLIIVLILLIVAALGIGGYFIYDKLIKGKDNPTPPPPTSNEVVEVNFVYLDTYNTGDCTYIKAGDTDILIDAGAIKSSAKVIKEYLDTKVTDGKLEYVIATHAHEDHIAGFVGTSKIDGIFESYKIGTLIEFAKTNSTSTLYSDYCEARDLALAENKMDYAYTALQCVKETDGAKKSYTIAEGTTLEILYQKYYENKASSENDYSVCCLIKQGSYNYLFTGDLEESGEISLVDSNSLPKCHLFKGGHHGSDTSNKDYLLDVIDPDVICLCCCAGSDEYAQSFPYQETINRYAKHTDQIFATTVATDITNNSYAPLNGTITYRREKDEYTVVGSNNSIILKETDWFKANRTWPDTSV